jgi:hypothetical protein
MDIFKDVLGLLEKNEKGLLTNEIASNLKLDRHTVSKYLHVLKEKGLIEFREIGKAKLWGISNQNKFDQLIEMSGKLGLDLTEIFSSLSDNVFVVDRNKDVVWSKNRLDICYAHHDKKDMCKNCIVEKTFSSGKKDISIINSKNGKVELKTFPVKDQKGNTTAVVEFSRRLK